LTTLNWSGFCTLSVTTLPRGPLSVIVLAFVVGAVITPPDVVSQLSLALPMVLLYEIGIWAAQIFIKHTQPPADDPA
jgi:Sec-independent protein secretion pathway component TatC